MSVITLEKQAAAGSLRDLEVVLAARGLDVTVEEEYGSLVAVNKAAAPDDPKDPLTIAYGPAKLAQRVVLARDEKGALCWFWQWSGPTRSSPPEYEHLAPAAAVAEAAELITRVLALVGQR
jgi:hypothetical protein